jgi:hypothetical protein
VLTKLLEHAALVATHAMPHSVHTHGQATMRVIVSLVLAAETTEIPRDFTTLVGLRIIGVQLL